MLAPIRCSLTRSTHVTEQRTGRTIHPAVKLRLTSNQICTGSETRQVVSWLIWRRQAPKYVPWGGSSERQVIRVVRITNRANHEACNKIPNREKTLVYWERLVAVTKFSFCCSHGFKPVDHFIFFFLLDKRNGRRRKCR